MTRTVLPAVLLVGLVLAACGEEEPAESTSLLPAVTAETSTPAEPASTPPPAEVSTTTALETTTTSVPPGDTAVVVAAEGVLGWWDGENWVQAQSSAPLDGNERFQVFRAGAEPAAADGAGLTRGCDLFEAGVGVALEPDPFPAFDPFAPIGIAVTASWDASPHPYELLPPSGAYVGVASELLAARGIDDPAPEFAQLFRTDIDGDGVNEVFGVVERRTGGDGALIAAPVGDYSIAFARFVTDDEVETVVLEESIVLGPDEAEGAFQDLVVFRLDAFADADGDGVDEVAVRVYYYEGSGVTLLDWLGVEEGFADVIGTGCGA